MKIERVRKQLSKKIVHPYLLQHITTPVIDEDKLLLLVSLLDQLGPKSDKVDHYVVTTMLLQIALDTHECVQNTMPEEDGAVLKNRQLTVLAGTYYSGLFYQQLAGIGEIEMFTSLATGVKEVNEHKIIVYHKDSEAIDKLMDSVRWIESALINKMVEAFGTPSWQDFATHLLLVKRLIKEEHQFISTKQSIVFEGLKKLAMPNNNQDLSKISEEQQRFLLSICERYIDYSVSVIENALKRLPTMDYLVRKRISEILGQHRSKSKIIMEEG